MEARVFNNKERNNEPQFVEVSVLLDETAVDADKYLRGELSFDEFSEMIDSRYKEADESSYDCHSFALGMMRTVFKEDVTAPPEFVRPERKDYESGADWQEAYVKAAQEMLESESGRAFRREQVACVRRFYEESKHLEIPNVNLDSDEEIAEGQRIGKDIARQITEKFLQQPESRVLMISDRAGEDINDVHYAVLAGAAGQDDMWVLQKIGAGDSVFPKKLSEVISSYVFNKKHGNLELNISQKPVAEFFRQSQEKNPNEENREKTRREMLIETGAFREEQEAAEYLRKLDNRFLEIHKDTADTQRYISQFQKMLDEAMAQLEIVSKLSDGKIANRPEVFAGIMEGIVDTFREHDFGAGKERKFEWNIFNAAKKCGEWVRDNKRALIAFTALSAALRLSGHASDMRHGNVGSSGIDFDLDPISEGDHYVEAAGDQEHARSLTADRAVVEDMVMSMGMPEGDLRDWEVVSDGGADFDVLDSKFVNSELIGGIIEDLQNGKPVSVNVCNRMTLAEGIMTGDNINLSLADAVGAEMGNERFVSTAKADTLDGAMMLAISNAATEKGRTEVLSRMHMVDQMEADQEARLSVTSRLANMNIYKMDVQKDAGQEGNGKIYYTVTIQCGL